MISGKDILRRQGIYLIVNSKDGGDILRQDHAKDFLGVLEWISRVKLISSAGRIFTYKDVCLHFQVCKRGKGSGHGVLSQGGSDVHVKFI